MLSRGEAVGVLGGRSWSKEDVSRLWMLNENTRLILDQCTSVNGTAVTPSSNLARAKENSAESITAFPWCDHRGVYVTVAMPSTATLTMKTPRVAVM